MSQPTESVPNPDGGIHQLLRVLTAVWLLVTAYLYWRWQHVTTTPPTGVVTVIIVFDSSPSWDDFLHHRGVEQLLRFVAAVITGPLVLAAVAGAGRMRRAAVGYIVLGMVLGVPAAAATYLHLQPYIH